MMGPPLPGLPLVILYLFSSCHLSGPIPMNQSSNRWRRYHHWDLYLWLYRGDPRQTWLAINRHRWRWTPSAFRQNSVPPRLPLPQPTIQQLHCRESHLFITLASWVAPPFSGAYSSSLLPFVGYFSAQFQIVWGAGGVTVTAVVFIIVKSTDSNIHLR